MKKNVKKYLIILIIFIVLVSIGVSLLMINKNTNLEPSDNNCLKKGNLCTLDEIKTGLVVPVAVNDNDTYDFYVIDNTAEQLILIMAKNIGKDVDWSMEGINFKGPVAPVFEVYDYTTNWDNINKITNYIYEDFGYKQCLALPDDSEEKNLCKFGGYIKFVINEKEAYVDHDIEELGNEDGRDYVLGDYDFKARLITVEEIEKLDNPSWLGNDLENGEGYWTMSSSTAANTSFNAGAYAVVKTSDVMTVESLKVTLAEIPYKVGVRPVITIPKSE